MSSTPPIRPLGHPQPQYRLFQCQRSRARSFFCNIAYSAAAVQHSMHPATLRRPGILPRAGGAMSLNSPPSAISLESSVVHSSLGPKNAFFVTCPDGPPVARNECRGRWLQVSSPQPCVMTNLGTTAAKYGAVRYSNQSRSVAIANGPPLRLLVQVTTYPFCASTAENMRQRALAP
ncbi:hypothetical protein EJ04DRAFT_512532 [Polyplosphaeria fusca]|uniref:Uncharacterized protein n=1 Tax=Polyplosphaeria fusca TaxID=682080 RepID=A0A9P4R0E0_9PLEO|nr:hypothetical protein EJ04DRAFT_512532 [Polyplosphaeria fusca]